MKRYFILGILVFIAFAVAFAPARLVDRALDQVPQVDLIDPRGTLWTGLGDLVFRGVPVGRVEWQFDKTSPLALAPTYAWRLSDTAVNLEGSSGISTEAAHLEVRGQFLADFINAYAREYDIHIEGDFTVRDTAVRFDPADRTIIDLDGQIDWTGGRVRYTLGGQLRETQLPPLTAHLGVDPSGSPQAMVFEDGGKVPLMTASQGAPGFIKIGMTKLFTKLLDTPWPGNDPDDAVVLEVEEQFL